MKSKNHNLEVFQEKITGAKAALIVVICLMYCFGTVILTYSISSNFRLLSYLIYLLTIVLLGKVAIKNLKEISLKKLFGWTILSFILVFVLADIIVPEMIEPILLQVLSVKKFDNANTASIISRFQRSTLIEKVLLFFGCTVLGPIVEELLYRVGMFRIIYQKNKVLGHLVTAFLFGLQHIFVAATYGNHPEEFLLIGSYVAYSLILTKVYVKTKTPLPGLLTHMILNTISVSIML